MARRRFGGIRQQNVLGEIEPIIKLWILRILVPLDGNREFLHEHGYSSDSIAKMIGLDEPDESLNSDFTIRSAQSDLRESYRLSEQTLGDASVSSCLVKNVQQISELVGLSETDCRILEFVVLIRNEQILDEAADWLGQLSSVKVFYALSVVLDITEDKIRRAFSPNGMLAKSGLVTIDRSGSSYLQAKLDIISDSFVDHIFSLDTNPVSLLRSIVSESSPPLLKIDDFYHMTEDLSVLRPYLRKSINSKRKGVNVFLFGSPGTGKSELTKVLAEELDCDLFEVASEDEEGDPIKGEKRLRAFRAAQNFFEKRNTLIAFDEAEDVFDDGDFMWGRKSTAQTRKAWINRMLEDNSVPTFWLSNSIRGIDPAFIRRFDMMIEIKVPYKKQREKILMDACGDIVDHKTISRISESEILAPAVVSRAADVVRTIKSELSDDGVSEAFERIINNTLETQGHRPVRRNDPNRLPEVYDPGFIHADDDVEKISEGLIKTSSGRLCLYGPPGTGKTAYGRWLSEQMNVPLLVKRGSDLISMWVGGTEENIAKAFKEAESEGALLLLDEVDGFLQDRRRAKNSWEVTGVNELLTQMESFSGVFVASTNLMDGIDQAALRRFDLKMKFNFLKPEQSWLLVKKYCKLLGIKPPDSKLKSKVKSLQNLAPGDFASVARRHRFQSMKTGSDLINKLVSECSVKEGMKRPIGFIH